MTPPAVLHQLIIRHRSRAEILCAVDGGRARLPSVACDDRHTAEVDYINAAVRERFGLVSTVLQSLRYDVDPRHGAVVRTHVLELHGSVAVPPGWRWCGADVVASLAEESAGVVAEWFAAARAPRVVSDGREWTVPGWFEAACEWIVQRVHDLGIGAVTDIVQLRAWQSSCVLRVVTPAGDLYFKAAPQSLQRECLLTAYLARQFGTVVPAVVATEPQRRWLLTRGFGRGTLEDVADARAWEHAAATYARLQVACMTRTDELRALGCPERGLDALAAAIEALAADDVALRCGAPDGLSSAEVERLRAGVPALQRRCAALAALAIPSTLEHGDLWPGNFLVDGTACVLIDWEDAAISHPFFSLAPLLVGLSTYQPTVDTAALRGALDDAYLAPFAAVGDSTRLRAALALAAPLSFLDMAIRYRRQPPSVVRLHPWMLDLVPQTLRLALARLE